MEICAYADGDLNAILRLFYDAVHTTCLGDYTRAQVDAWADGKPDREAWARSLNEHFSLVARMDGEIVGFGDIDESGYLDRLYVRPDAQRRGVATALCERLEAHARGKVVTVHASITALPFFLRRGYRLLRAQTVLRRGVALNNFMLEKARIFAPEGGVPMRRKERQVVERSEIAAVIDRCKVLRLGLNVPGGAPYIVPMNFGWAWAEDAPVFYLHCAGEGRRLDLLRLDPRVGFEMDGAHALRGGGAPCLYTYDYESVIGTGRVEFVEAEEEKAAALEAILLHQTGRTLPVSAEDARGVTVLRLRADAWSCKRNTPPRA